MVWYKRNSRRTHPVGEKEPNRFGLHEMHGNVREWCEDWYQSDYYDESAGANDPLCENSNSGWRVIRGGSWYVPAWYCRSAFRFKGHPSVHDFTVGFRPAWSSP